jgi:hypothetical protein
MRVVQINSLGDCSEREQKQLRTVPIGVEVGILFNLLAPEFYI